MQKNRQNKSYGGLDNFKHNGVNDNLESVTSQGSTTLEMDKKTKDKRKQKH